MFNFRFLWLTELWASGRSAVGPFSTTLAIRYPFWSWFVCCTYSPEGGTVTTLMAVLHCCVYTDLTVVLMECFLQDLLLYPSVRCSFLLSVFMVLLLIDNGGLQFRRLAHVAGSHCKTWEDSSDGGHFHCRWPHRHIIQHSSSGGGELNISINYLYHIIQ